MGATMGKGGGNFLDALPSQGTLHVVMLGLDSAGKTTALYRLKFDQYLNTVPTIGFNCEKVQGAMGKAKGVQFLVWDVGGQEKLRPLWRSYTRCTDGILFVIDSVDTERMEEAKMELMRTAKCPDNQGVPVLILANKQDLPGACDPKELEKLLGLHELLNPTINASSMCVSSATSGIIVASNCTVGNSHGCNKFSNSTTLEHRGDIGGSESSEAISSKPNRHVSQTGDAMCETISSSEAETLTTPPSSSFVTKQLITTSRRNSHQFKGWYIQPACAITGEGLQEGLEALYEMILKRRKLNKAYKKKR